MPARSLLLQHTMKKLICYSLYGNNPAVYSDVLLANILPLRELYDDSWTVRVYCGDDVPNKIVTQLDSHAEIVQKHNPGGRTGMFWRFEPIFETDVERFVTLDADDIISQTFRYAVEKWEESDKDLLAFRWCRYRQRFFAGYFGAKGGILHGKQSVAFPELSYQEQFHHIVQKVRTYGEDEHWLATVAAELSCFSVSVFGHKEEGCLALDTVSVPESSVIRKTRPDKLMRYGNYPVHHELGLSAEEKKEISETNKERRRCRTKLP